MLDHCYCHYHSNSERKALLHIAASYTEYICHTLYYFLQGLIHYLTLKDNRNE